MYLLSVCLKKVKVIFLFIKGSTPNRIECTNTALNYKATILKLVFRFSTLNQSQIVLGNGQEPNGLNKIPAVRERDVDPRSPMWKWAIKVRFARSP